MRRYQFAHDEDDLNNPGLRRRSGDEDEHRKFDETMRGFINVITWPMVRNFMKNGYRIEYSLYRKIMRWGTEEHKLEVENYVKTQPGGGYGVSGAKIFATVESAIEFTKDGKEKNVTDPPKGGSTVVQPPLNTDYVEYGPVPLLGVNENKQEEYKPVEVEYSYTVFEEDTLEEERKKIIIKEPLNESQKELFQWDLAESIMREVNQPGTKNYSEKEFQIFVRRSLKEGWMPGKTPVPNARKPRIVGMRGDIPKIEALNYDEAFLFARTATPPYQKFDAMYIIQGWEILKNSGIELSSREGGLNRRNYELRAERGEIMPYELFYNITNDETNFKKLKIYPNHKSKLQSDEFVALVRGTQSALGFPADGILTDELLSAAREKESVYIAKREIRSKKDTLPVFIAKLYYISGDLTLYKKAIQEASLSKEIRTNQHLKALASSAGEILFFNNNSIKTPVYPGDDFYRAVDNWEDQFKGDERAMDLHRIRTLAQLEYQKTQFKRQQLETEINKLESELGNPYRKKSEIQGINGTVDINDWSLKSQIDGKKEELKKLQYQNLAYQFNDRETFSKSQGFHSNHSNINGKQWTDQDFPLDNPFAINDQQYYSGTSSVLLSPAYSPGYALNASFEFQNGIYNNEKLNKQMLGELGQTSSGMVKTREDALFNQRTETALHLGTNDSVAKSWAAIHETFEPMKAAGNVWFIGIQINSSIDSLNVAESTAVTTNKLFQRTDNYYIYARILRELAYRVNTSGTKSPMQQKMIHRLYNFYSLFKDRDAAYSLPAILPGRSEFFGVSRLVLYADMLFDYYSNGKLGHTHIAERMSELSLSLDSISQTQSQFGTVNLLPNRYLLQQDQNEVQQQYSIRKERRSMIKDGVSMPIFWKKVNNNYTLIVDQGGGDTKVVEFTLDKYFSNKDEQDSYAIHRLISKLEQWNGLPKGELTYATPDKQIGFKKFEEHISWSDVLGWLSIAVFVVGAVFTGGATLGLIGLTAAALSVASVGVGLYEKSQTGELSGSDWALAGLSVLSSVLPAGQLAGKLGSIKGAVGKIMSKNKLFAGVSAVSSGSDTVINGYIMASDFAASFDALEGIKDEKERDKARQKLLLMALINGTLTYHSFKGDVKDLYDLKAGGHIIPDDLLNMKKVKVGETLPSRIGGTSSLPSHTKVSSKTGDHLSTSTHTKVKDSYGDTNTFSSGAKYDPAKGHPNWKTTKQENVKLFTEADAQGNIHYKRSDSSGTKELTKEEFDNQYKIAQNEKHRADSIALAEIEGQILDRNGNIDTEKLKAFFKQLEDEGVKIITGKNAEALLDKHNANALYIPGDKPGQPGMIVLREGADRQHIIEEIFHLRQHQAEGYRTLSAGEIIDMEIEAHEYMLEYGRAHGWTEAEILQLERNKGLWEGDKKRFHDPAEVDFRKKFISEQKVFKNKDDLIPDENVYPISLESGREKISIITNDGDYYVVRRNSSGDWEIEQRPEGKGTVNDESVIEAAKKYESKNISAPKEKIPEGADIDVLNPVDGSTLKESSLSPAENILSRKLDFLKKQPVDFFGELSYDEVVLQLNKLDEGALNALSNMPGLSGENILGIAKYIKDKDAAVTMSLFLNAKNYSNDGIKNLISDIEWYQSLVRERNPNLYNPDRPLQNPSNFDIEKKEKNGFVDGVKREGNKSTISYDITQKNRTGNFTRSFESGKLSIEGSSLDMTGKGEVPNKVYESPQLSSDSNFTPTVVWVTLMQMQQLGINPGSLSTISLSNIMNIESVFQYSWLKKKNVANANELMQTSRQYIYAETIAIQSGHTVNNVSISENGIQPRSIDEFINAYKKNYPGITIINDIEQLSKKYGVTDLYWGFDINLSLSPKTN
ncbi:MAG: hypothetical protein MUC87_20385 [Bacteroidia bacterium]|jgi:hypothetical protein|nr:hypothetical protein [Bacteroidia bacterium]